MKLNETHPSFVKWNKSPGQGLLPLKIDYNFCKNPLLKDIKNKSCRNCMKLKLDKCHNKKWWIAPPIRKKVKTKMDCQSFPEIEEWKPVNIDDNKYAGIYEVSTWGRVIKIKTGKIVARNIHHITGRVYVNLKDKDNISKKQQLPRVVAMAHVHNTKNMPFDKLEVNHIDKDPHNNYYRNLEWLTHAENIDHERKLRGRIKKHSIHNTL